MSAFYAWLRRHPGLVDGVPAVALAFAGLGQAIATGRYLLIPALLALVIALAFRRSYPAGAFVTGIVVGFLQVVLDIRANFIDIAIVILLYTLAAYRPRRLSLPGLGVCLIGAAVAMAVWRPITGTLLNWLITGTIIFAGPCLTAWVLGDSMRYRRAYYAAARRAGPGRLPDRAGVADQYPQARRPGGQRPGAAAVLRGCAGAADHRRRFRGRCLGGRRRSRADRHARAGGAV